MTELQPCTLVASSYLWRCPECDSANVVSNALTPDVICEACRACFTVFEVRHRTHDRDLAPGRSPGALRRVREQAQRFIKQKYTQELIPDGGVLLISSGYLWSCPRCGQVNHLRSPLDIEGADRADSAGSLLACPACGMIGPVGSLYHSADRDPIGPPIAIRQLFIP